MVFVTSGLRFDPNALFATASTMARVPLFLLAIYLAVVSWSRRRTRSRLMGRSTGDRHADERHNQPEDAEQDQRPAVLVETLPEKNSDSRMIARNSAIDADATTG